MKMQKAGSLIVRQIHLARFAVIGKLFLASFPDANRPRSVHGKSSSRKMDARTFPDRVEPLLQASVWTASQRQPDYQGGRRQNGPHAQQSRDEALQFCLS